MTSRHRWRLLPKRSGDDVGDVRYRCAKRLVRYGAPNGAEWGIAAE